MGVCITIFRFVGLTVRFVVFIALLPLIASVYWLRYLNFRRVMYVSLTRCSVPTEDARKMAKGFKYVKFHKKRP
jgi:hypothetical protein